MRNLAGSSEADSVTKAELIAAGIPWRNVYRSCGEVATCVIGLVGDWILTRRWYYWSAESPTGLSRDAAVTLYQKAGAAVRLDGHCDPKSWWESKGEKLEGALLYHIDTVEGLGVFAEAVRQPYPTEGPETP